MRISAILLLCLIVVSCDDDDELGPQQIEGFWQLQTTYVNGVEIGEYYISMHLHILPDNTFRRQYDTGTWQLSNNTLLLERIPGSGFGDWTYEIAGRGVNKLTLEKKEKDSRTGELLNIREVYIKVILE